MVASVLALVLAACSSMPEPLSNRSTSTTQVVARRPDAGGEYACSSFYYWVHGTPIVFGGCWWVRRPKETP